MRVGIDAAGALRPWTGVGRYSEELVRGLAGQPDLELRLLANDFRGASPAIAEELDLPVTNPRLPSRLLLASWRWLNWPPVERLVGDIDIFHWSDWVHPPVADAAIVGTVHDVAPLVHPEWYAPEIAAIHSQRNTSLARRADAIITVSEFTREAYLELFDVDPDRVHAVLSGVSSRFRPGDAEAVEALRRSRRLERPYLLYVGTRERRKNVAGLIEIFSRVAGEEPDVDLVLVGTRPWAEARDVHGVEAWTGRELEARIEALGLADRVEVAGKVSGEELRLLYSGASCLVFPSLYEGFGFPAAEAMACGAPVVASSRSALPEVVGDAGLLADPEDHGSFAQRILDILRDSELAAALRARGIERSTELTWDRTAQATRAVYDRVRPK